MPFSLPSVPHARGCAQGSGDGCQDGDGDVQNLLPDVFGFHSFSFSFFVDGFCGCFLFTTDYTDSHRFSLSFTESFLFSCHPEEHLSFLSFRRPSGGRRVVEPKAKNLVNIHVDALEILRYALDDIERNYNSVRLRVLSGE